VASSLSSTTSCTSGLARGTSANGTLPPIPRSAMGGPAGPSARQHELEVHCVAGERASGAQRLTPVAPLVHAEKQYHMSTLLRR